MAVHKAPNCLIQLLLLVWKNFSMLLGRKCYMISLLVFFAILPLLLMSLRLIPPLRSKPQINEPIPTIGLLSTMPLNIYFAPKTQLLESLVKEINSSKITAFENSQELQKALIDFSDEKSKVIGIEFAESWTEWPDKLSFALRAPERSASDTNDKFSMSGSTLYYGNGFLAVQLALSKAHINHKCKELECPKEMQFPEFRDLPSPPIFESDYTGSLHGLGKIYITVLIYFVVISLTKSIVEEKELQLKETLNLLGVGSGLQWLAWYVQTFIIVFIGSAIITLCWKVILPQSEISFLPFSPWSLVLFVLVILGHCCICFSFLMSSLISTTRRVSLISILSVFATQYPEVILYSVGCSVGLNAFISLFLLSGLALLSYGVCNWDFYGVGLQWDNLFDIAWPGDTISVGHILLIMLLASFVSLLICLYMEQIRPGTYGVPRPWHFPCSCCCPTENLLPYMRLFYRCLGINRAAPDVERPEVELIEADPEGKTAGVQIIGLSKTFGKMEAVKNISFDMFEDQVTVLMGHNGAGKTTLISMLAGFIPPTSGTALVNGYDIQKERRQARRCIGLCPQQNVLFKHLSSASHIWFFSRLRGLRGAEVKAEVDKCLEQLNLKGKKKAAARNLSGGAQRRLSVACALCGGVKVLICDEPSTGLDPSARRELWKLILEAKEGCTILLTTHQLDDGEVLGDRMVIISDGQVRCIGSLPFLKKLVDASCLLTCETRKRCDVDKLTSLISLHVGSITPFSIKGRDVCYKLPLSKSNSFSSLFRDLELKKKELGIRGFGMSSVSLEEIFMSFGAEDLDYRKSGGADNKDDSYDDGEDQDENVQNCRSQWRAMMTKKWLSLYDNKVYFLLLMLIPIVYYLSTLISATDPHSLARVSMNVEGYGDYGVTILVSDSGKSGEMRPAYYTISRMAGKDVELKVIRDPVEGYVKSALTTPEGRREIMFMPMAVELENPLVGWVGPRHFVHSAPMTLNLVYNVMAHDLLGPKIRLKVTSAPYKEGRKANSLDVDGKAMRYQFYIVFYVCVAMILFANLIIQERDSHMKMQQEVSGLSMVTYWLSHLVFDMLVYLILALALLLAIYNYAPWYSLLTVLLFMGLTGLIFAYFLTLVLSASLLAVSLIILFAYLASIVITIVGLLALLFDLENMVIFIIYVAFLHPILSGYFSIGKCFQYFSLCSSEMPGSEELPVRNDINCANPSGNSIPRCVCENLMLYPEMLCMIAGAIIFWIIMMFHEYGSCIWYKLNGCCTPKPTGSIEDPKVAKEAEKIKNLDTEKRESRALVVDEVSKQYCCGPLAVNNISFALKPHFCLGLLGPNGAGKTSTFKMIVGEQSIDRGNIYIAGYSMKKKRRKAMKELGYCPQFDSFFEFFTGRQMVKFFLQLRGTESKKLKVRSEQLADQFGFRKHLDEKIKYYSGGTKRKINAAVACGAKSLICLDEPSAGVDPASRRHVWNIIDETATKGKAVLLTSHNMDEINALCSKSVILVNGSIYAMGSNQHVKSKIVNRLALKLVVNVKTDDMNRVLLKIEDELTETFPNASLKEKYEFSGRLTFQIPEEGSSWSKIFDFVESNRGSWQLADYSISQPSFEDVFEEIAEEGKRKRRM